MRIAIFIDDICIPKLKSGVKHIFLFDVDNELVKAIGEELMRITDINYVCLWLLGKRVKVIYYDGFSAVEKTILERSGMKIRVFDEIKDHPILEALLVKLPKPQTPEGAF
ncbi:MAG: hypothetical protein LBV72_06425 [Tannerella sp.]|jgi:hypothetical protein|nr:hypothetical protein [Tannerella sp.]